VDMDVLLLELMSSGLAHGRSPLPTPHKAPEAEQAFSTATNHNSSSTMTTSEDPFFSYSHLNNFERHTISGRKIPCMLCLGCLVRGWEWGAAMGQARTHEF